MSCNIDQVYGVPKESVPHSREAWGDQAKKLYKAELEAWGKTLNRDRSYDEMMAKLADEKRKKYGTTRSYNGY